MKFSYEMKLPMYFSFGLVEDRLYYVRTCILNLSKYFHRRGFESIYGSTSLREFHIFEIISKHN